MKRFFLTTITAALLAGTALAAPVGLREATRLAEKFLSAKNGVQTRAQHVSAAVKLQHNATAEMPYYIFNSEDGDGFVVVAGDDRARNVLAYSCTGNLEADDMPEACRYWLSNYSEEIKSLISGDTSYSGEVAGNPGDFSAVEPIIETRWGQQFPYNAKCPYEKNTVLRCPTGCVATATAQVMRRYSYPPQATGSVTYADAKQEVERSLDFSTLGPFDWDHMTLTYSASSSKEENDAVATLMMAAGYGIGMQYSLEVSMAYNRNAGTALINYFGYNPDLHFYERNLMTDGEWEEIILSELHAGRPVIYDGRNPSMGHTFICDGYDGNGLYHFNWGWTGVSDGYFALSALNPGEQMTGGSDGGYNDSQSIICNIVPSGADNAGPQESYLLTIDKLYFRDARAYYVAADTPELATSLQDAHLFFYCFNKGFKEFDGEIWAAEIKGEEISPLVMAQTNPIGSGGYVGASFPLSETTLSDGPHDIVFIYRKNKEAEWHRVTTSPDQPSAARVTVTGNDITLVPLKSVAGEDSGVGMVADDDVCVRIDGTMLTVKSSRHIAEISLFDIAGRRAACVSPDSEEAVIDVSRFGEGVYILTARYADGACRSVKILK